MNAGWTTWRDYLDFCLQDDAEHTAAVRRIAHLPTDADRKLVAELVMIATMSEWHAARPIRYDLVPLEERA